jgi:hypothetical protein
MIAIGLFAEFRAYSDMDNPNQKPTDEQLQQGLAGLREIGAIFDELCRGLEPAGGFRIASMNYNDPEESGGSVHPDDWPKGLAEYLDGCDWDLPANEFNLMVPGLERYWKLPRDWGVDIDTGFRTIDVGPIDNPEVKDR